MDSSDTTIRKTEPTRQTGRFLRLGGKSLSLDRPRVMGVLNVTPDSFSEGGLFHRPEAALTHARRMLDEGADIIDIGAESTRPHSTRITTEEELRRLLPVLGPLLDEGRAVLSVDTSNPEVAEEVLRRGVPLINDVRGLRNPDLRQVIGGFKASAVIMHMQGEPENMQDDPRYDDVVGEVREYLAQQAELATAAGIQQVIVDPGIGFGKTAEQNLLLIQHLGPIVELGYPVLIGPSRKSFMGKILGLELQDRLEATIAACVVALVRGARIFRVHDVQPVRRALDMAEAIVTQSSGAEST